VALCGGERGRLVGPQKNKKSANPCHHVVVPRDERPPWPQTRPAMGQSLLRRIFQSPWQPLRPDCADPLATLPTARRVQSPFLHGQLWRRRRPARPGRAFVRLCVGMFERSCVRSNVFVLRCIYALGFGFLCWCVNTFDCSCVGMFVRCRVCTFVRLCVCAFVRLCVCAACARLLVVR
jgi:hypothetical protein